MATTVQVEEAVADLLEATLGAAACSYTDFEKTLTTVSVYLKERPQGWTAKRARLAAGLCRLRVGGLRIGRGGITLTRMRQRDWAESWKDHFRPIQIGRSLMIQPSWTKRPPKPGQAVVVLDPGLSFGTGNHPTTLYCLRELLAARRLGLEQSVLDLGTGSGILAIAAAKLGFHRVEAVDVDADCVRVARENAARNRVAHKIRIARRDVADQPSGGQRRYSVVCANLITPVLLAQSQNILARLAPGGRLVLAGILAAEFPEVQRTYEAAGLRLVHGQTRKEWRSGSFGRPD